MLWSYYGGCHTNQGAFGLNSFISGLQSAGLSIQPATEAQAIRHEAFVVRPVALRDFSWWLTINSCPCSKRKYIRLYWRVGFNIWGGWVVSCVDIRLCQCSSRCLQQWLAKSLCWWGKQLCTDVPLINWLEVGGYSCRVLTAHAEYVWPLRTRHTTWHSVNVASVIAWDVHLYHRENSLRSHLYCRENSLQWITCRNRLTYLLYILSRGLSFVPGVLPAWFISRTNCKYVVFWLYKTGVVFHQCQACQCSQK